MIPPMISQHMRERLNYQVQALPLLNLTFDRTTSNSEYVAIWFVCVCAHAYACVQCSDLGPNTLHSI